jgi:hypothetical protein
MSAKTPLSKLSSSVSPGLVLSMEGTPLCPYESSATLSSAGSWRQGKLVKKVIECLSSEPSMAIAGNESEKGLLLQHLLGLHGSLAITTGKRCAWWL